MAKKTRRKKPATRKKAPRRKAARKPPRKAAAKKPVRKPKQSARKATPKKKLTRKKPRKPAAVTSSVRFPGEDARYRKARDQLLKSEVELRRHTEAVAVERRKLPLGGEVPEDYEFQESDRNGGVRSVKLSALFAPDKHTLVMYNFMYGPKMERACPSCSSILDALDGNAKHISQRVNFAVVVRSPLPRMLSHARDRGWYATRFLSSADNSYNRDYHGETADGSQRPMLNVFVKRGGKIRHTWGSELAYTVAEKGQEPRHVDFMWPLWNVFDVTPDGRGKDWRPKLSYF